MRSVMVASLLSLSLAACVNQPAGWQIGPPRTEILFVFGRAFDAGPGWQGATWFTEQGGFLTCAVERLGPDGTGVGVLHSAGGFLLQVIHPDAARLSRAMVVQAGLQFGRFLSLNVAMRSEQRLSRMPTQVAELQSAPLTPGAVLFLKAAGWLLITVPGLSSRPIEVSVEGIGTAIDVLEECTARRGDVTNLGPRPVAPPAPAPPPPASTRPAPATPPPRTAPPPPPPQQQRQQPPTPWALPPPA